MKMTNNVASATTTNSGKSVNSNNNNSINANGVNVANVEVIAEDVADVEVQKLEEGKLYYGCSHNSMKKDRIVYVVKREHSRGVDMVEYEEWSRNVNGYDDNGNAKYVWTMNRYRKSVKLSGDAESMVRTEYVDGPHGVSANHTITEEEMKKNSILNNGLLEMSEDDYNVWEITMNELNMRGCLRAHYTTDDVIENDNDTDNMTPEEIVEEKMKHMDVEWLKNNIDELEVQMEYASYLADCFFFEGNEELEKSAREMYERYAHKKYLYETFMWRRMANMTV